MLKCFTCFHRTMPESAGQINAVVSEKY